MVDEYGALAASLAASGTGYLEHASPNPQASAAYRWVDVIEETAARRVSMVAYSALLRKSQAYVASILCKFLWAVYRFAHVRAD